MLTEGPHVDIQVLGKPIGDDLLPEVRRGGVLVSQVNRNGDEDGKDSQ